MAKRGVRHAAIDMRHRRKRRVHQDDARADICVEMIVDLRRIETRDRQAWKQLGEKPGAGIRQLIEGERAAGELGEDRKKPRAGRGLQHEVGRRNRGRRPRRRSRAGIGVRKLLQRLALFGAPRMGRQQSRHLCQHREASGGVVAAPASRAELAQEQDGRRLAGLVGGFPVPGASGIGSAEGRFHRRAEHAGIDALSAFEMGKKPRSRAGDG